jgi:DNA-binding MarR family transcriptional regulator
VNGELLAIGNRLVGPLGLTSARWQVLGCIAIARKPMTVPTIARQMGLTRQGVQKQVDLLLAEGLVRLQKNPANRGSPLVALTRAGHGANQRAFARWIAHADKLVKPIPANEIAVASEVISMLGDCLRTRREARRPSGDD